MNMEGIIETVDISKVYKLRGKDSHIKALNNINLSVDKGEIFGLLGPNGAGKTTLIHIFTTITQPTSGSAKVNGFNVLTQKNQVKSSIGLMLGSDMLYYRITGYDNLKFFCKIYKISNYKKKIEEYVKEFGLSEWLNQYVEYYSSGMKMKLALCRTLILDRDILLLDEPTLGLDLPTTNFIIQKLKSLKKTIFLTSHDMNVVEQLCDRVAFINKGEILKIGTKKEIRELIKSNIRVRVDMIENKNQLLQELESKNFIDEVHENDSGLEIILKQREDYQLLIKILGNYKVLKVNEPEISLHELFLRIIK